MHPWHPAGDSGRAKTSLQADDEAEFDYVAEKYRALHGGADAPDSPAGEGSFSEWAYFQYGRWSFAARGWWIPKVEPPADAAEEPKKLQPGVVPPLPKPSKPVEKRKPPSGETRGAEQVNALNWMAREKIDGFVPWTPIQHPDFPGRKVEVGGFKPFVLLNPPAKELDPLADRHTDFVLELARLMPRLKISEARAEPLGGGIQRITRNRRKHRLSRHRLGDGPAQRRSVSVAFATRRPEGLAVFEGHPAHRIGTHPRRRQSSLDMVDPSAGRQAGPGHRARFGPRRRLRNGDA